LHGRVSRKLSTHDGWNISAVSAIYVIRISLCPFILVLDKIQHSAAGVST
jgi:hypothetical protein